MNNEPVAWMLLGLEDHKPKLINLQVIEHLEGTWIPLYTHPANPKYDPETGEPLIDGYPLFSGLPPAPAKTLTDEEIISSAEEAGFNWSEDKGIFVRHSNGSWIGLDSKMVDFARAILRKAQEK